MKTITTLAACAASLLLAAAAPAFAAELKLPQDLPPYGADKPVPVPKSDKHTLANGLTVWIVADDEGCLLYTSPSPRDGLLSRMPSSA